VVKETWHNGIGCKWGRPVRSKAGTSPGNGAAGARAAFAPLRHGARKKSRNFLAAALSKGEVRTGKRRFRMASRLTASLPESRRGAQSASKRRTDFRPLVLCPSPGYSRRRQIEGASECRGRGRVAG